MRIGIGTLGKIQICRKMPLGILGGTYVDIFGQILFEFLHICLTGIAPEDSPLQILLGVSPSMPIGIPLVFTPEIYPTIP